MRLNGTRVDWVCKEEPPQLSSSFVATLFTASGCYGVFIRELIPRTLGRFYNPCPMRGPAFIPVLV